MLDGLLVCCLNCLRSHLKYIGISVQRDLFILQLGLEHLPEVVVARCHVQTACGEPLVAHDEDDIGKLGVGEEKVVGCLKMFKG